MLGLRIDYTVFDFSWSHHSPPAFPGEIYSQTAYASSLGTPRMMGCGKPLPVPSPYRKLRKTMLSERSKASLKVIAPLPRPSQLRMIPPIDLPIGPRMEHGVFRGNSQL